MRTFDVMVSTKNILKCLSRFMFDKEQELRKNFIGKIIRVKNKTKVITGIVEEVFLESDKIIFSLHNDKNVVYELDDEFQIRESLF